MKKHIPTIIFVLIFLTGLSVMLYPSVSDLINQRNQSKVITDYNAEVAAMTPEDFAAEWAAAQAYNDDIRGYSNISAAVRAETNHPNSQYKELLNPGGKGVMGLIKIPSVKISLPVYHTTEETVLQIGAGHYVGSSLPIGGEGSHSIITGHRGLPSAKLFTDLDQVKEGDQFYLYVLDQVLAYEVVQIQVVLPEEVDNLSIVPGEDYVTLVTCTPYGVNSHRMLIRGSRIAYEESVTDRNGTTTQRTGPTVQNPQLDTAPFIIAAIILVICILFLWLGKKRSSRRSSRNKVDKEGGGENK